MTNFLNLFVSFAVFFRFTNAANESDADTYRVIGGYRHKTHPLAKHIVSIRLSIEMEMNMFGIGHICGGSILTPNTILTAAHCTQIADLPEITPAYIYVVAGSIDRLVEIEGVQKIRVKEIINHKGFTLKGVQHDIAILRLKTDLVEDGVTVQRIPMATETTPPGTICTSFGWGYMVPNANYAAELTFVKLKIISNEKSRRLHPQSIWRKVFNLRKYIINKYTICLVDPGNERPQNTVCNGDSGGPLICNDKLVGVVSFSFGICGDSDYAVFTNVFRHRDWIENA